MTVVEIAAGLYRVSDEGRHWTVAVAGPADNRWVWVGGHVMRLEPPAAAAGRKRGSSSHQDLSAPMPATVVKVLVRAGEAVSRGATLLMLEAMKMELPIRAAQDGIVKAVHCKEGELVQPGSPLLELE